MPRVGDKGYQCVLVHREQRPMIHILEYQVQAVDEANNEITYSYGPQVVITPIRGAKIVAESVSAAWELYTKEAVADLQIGHHLEEEAEAYQKKLRNSGLAFRPYPSRRINPNHLKRLEWQTLTSCK